MTIRWDRDLDWKWYLQIRARKIFPTQQSTLPQPYQFLPPQPRQFWGFLNTHMIADLLAKAEIMKVLAEIYDPILTEVPYLYDEIEYYLCEVRRHLLHPVSRGTSSDLKFGKTPSSW